MEVKELTFSCYMCPLMPWSSTVSTLSSQRPRRAEPWLPLNAHSGMATWLFRAGECLEMWCPHPWRLWCPLLVGFELCPGHSWWMEQGCSHAPALGCPCRLQPVHSGQLRPGCPLQVCLWTGKVCVLLPWNGLRVVSLSSQITLKSVQIVNSRSFLEQQLLQLTLVQPQKAIPLKRNYYYNINPPKHTQRNWFRTRYRKNLFSLSVD